MKRQLSVSDQRVHPYAELAPIQYPSVQESNGDGHGMQMHKEQEKELRGGQIVSNNGGFSEEAAAAAAAPGRKQRRRRRCLRCCCCVGACVGTILVIVGILVLLFFLILHPKLPKYTITDASIRNFTMRNASSTIASATIIAEQVQEETVYLSVDLELRVRMENPNKKIGIDYRAIKGTLIYDGVDIGEGSIPAFYQGHKNVTYVELAMQGRDIALTPSLGNTLRNTLSNEDSIALHARTIVHVRIKIGRWKTHTSKVRVKCTVQLSNPTRGSVRLLHNHCKFKLLRLRL